MSKTKLTKRLQFQRNKKMKTIILDRNITKKSQKTSNVKSLNNILAKKSAILNDILSRADLSTLPKSTK